MLPMGCSQQMTNHSKWTNPARHGTPLMDNLGHKAPSWPGGNCFRRIFLPNFPSFLLSITGVKFASWSEDSLLSPTPSSLSFPRVSPNKSWARQSHLGICSLEVPPQQNSKSRLYHSQMDLPQIKRFHFEIYLENAGVTPVLQGFLDSTVRLHEMRLLKSMKVPQNRVAPNLIWQQNFLIQFPWIGDGQTGTQITIWEILLTGRHPPTSGHLSFLQPC